MEKKLITTFILLFTVMTVSYAGLYKSKSVPNEAEERSGGALYKSPSDGSLSFDNQGSGLFKSDPLSPGDRPGNGGGIGQSEAEDEPIGDGIIVLSVCCAIMVVVKGVANKIKRKPHENQEEQ